jgi:hypothetical protein
LVSEIGLRPSIPPPKRQMLSLLNQIEQSGLATSIHESGSLWGYPLILFLHTLGFGTLVGINAAIDLRLLGFGAGIPLKSFEKTFRLMWGGFALNAITGSLLFITDAVKHGTNPAFYVKLTFVAAGLFVLTRIRKNVFRASGTDEAAIVRLGKILGATSLGCWLIVITAARLMAYIAEYINA